MVLLMKLFMGFPGNFLIFGNNYTQAYEIFIDLTYEIIATEQAFKTETSTFKKDENVKVVNRIIRDESTHFKLSDLC